jgi:hypothetical protein
VDYFCPAADPPCREPFYCRTEGVAAPLVYFIYTNLLYILYMISVVK